MTTPDEPIETHANGTAVTVDATPRTPPPDVTDADALALLADARRLCERAAAGTMPRVPPGAARARAEVALRGVHDALARLGITLGLVDGERVVKHAGPNGKDLHVRGNARDSER
jgi:hypothetical protein